MKEYKISEIHSIRHPFQVNVHQSACAHDLIKIYITNHQTEQQIYFHALQQSQRKCWWLFLLLKTCQLEDCGGENRGELKKLACDSYRFFGRSWQVFNLTLLLYAVASSFLPYFLLSFLPYKDSFKLSLIVCLSQSLFLLLSDLQSRESSGYKRANRPSSQCELWVWSGQIPTETTFPLQTSGCTHPEYCRPTEKPFRHSEDLQ